MNLTTEKTVREIALESPATTRALEKLGIDYCCGGNQTLDQACRTANISIDEVLKALDDVQAGYQPGPSDHDWQTDSLTDLVGHINRTHHKYVREEIARLGPLFQKGCSVHGQNHPELLRMQNTFSDLAQELTMHMMKEEMVLFPYVVRMEEAVIQREPVVPPPFGTVQNPVSMMMHEHDNAGIALRVLRQASNDYMPPPDACVSYQTLYRALADFEADLHQHIHLENNILFPKALAMEGRH
jgi:regulator of cell morphogenesis and NO signaling